MENVLNKKNVKFIIVAVLVLAIVSVVFVVTRLSQKRSDNTKVIQVEGLAATWEDVNREIDLDYFYQLDGTKTYEQIEKEIGKPNGYRGSGLVLPYYQISRNRFVVISFSLDEYGEYDKVGRIYLCDEKEVLEEIYPKQMSDILYIENIKNNEGNTEGEKSGNSISVSGILASYKYVDRDINLEYFYKLNNTSTYEQILEEIGEPNGQFGSGIIYQYYEIDNNLYVSILFSGSENEEYDKISLIRLCTQEEVLDTIYPR